MSFLAIPLNLIKKKWKWGNGKIPVPAQTTAATGIFFG